MNAEGIQGMYSVGIIQKERCYIFSLVGPIIGLTSSCETHAALFNIESHG
jgi:hypothetical protein